MPTSLTRSIQLRNNFDALRDSPSHEWVWALTMTKTTQGKGLGMKRSGFRQRAEGRKMYGTSVTWFFPYSPPLSPSLDSSARFLDHPSPSYALVPANTRAMVSTPSCVSNCQTWPTNEQRLTSIRVTLRRVRTDAGAHSFMEQRGWTPPKTNSTRGEMYRSGEIAPMPPRRGRLHMTVNFSLCHFDPKCLLTVMQLHITLQTRCLRG
jgi:hypothetical protein